MIGNPSRKKRYTFFYLLLTGAGVILFPFFSLANKTIAYYAYKEVTYDVIIAKVIKAERSVEKQVILINNFLYDNFSNPYNAEVVDKDIFNDFIRGIAWCDQRAWALVTFAGKLGRDARLVFTKSIDGNSTHTVSEVLIRGKWMLFDPQFGFFAYKKDNTPASYDDVCFDPSLFFLSKRMLILKQVPHRYMLTKDLFSSGIYYENYHQPVFWGNPVFSRDSVRKIIAGVVNAYANVFGDFFANFYQDIYLAFYCSGNTSAQVYLRARNYDLYSRFSLAAVEYQKLINNFPAAKEAQDAQYFLGVLYTKNGNYGLSVTIFNALLINYPEKKWLASAHYYLGYNYELLKNNELSARHYKTSLELYEDSSPDSLVSDEFKVIERLYGSVK